ncbi:MAG: response regulator [Deltaproteobacteria bacterium]|nr:response regulator [Deltaproteobacteria bacterium]
MSQHEPIVLVVEDEAPMRRFLKAALTASNYRVVEAVTAAETLLLAPTHNPDVVLLDLGLPDLDGIEVTRRLREWCTAPIIVISARGREEDKVEALDAGADDYLTKPFGTGELLARLRVALRGTAHGSPESETRLTVGDLVIDLVARVVTRGGVELHFTPTEYRLLALLAKNVGRVLTHRQILREVWGPNAVAHTHYVRVQMAEIRKKIEADPARPRLLVTEPGVGTACATGDDDV